MAAWRSYALFGVSWEFPVLRGVMVRARVYSRIGAACFVRGIAKEPRGQDMNGIITTTGSRHGRLARQRGLPGQADVDSHLT